MNDNYLVQAALTKSPCGNVTLQGGYQATYAEAERDLAETYQAFQAASQTIDYENGNVEARGHVLAACMTGAAVVGYGGPGAAAGGCFVGAIAEAAVQASTADAGQSEGVRQGVQGPYRFPWSFR